MNKYNLDHIDIVTSHLCNKHCNYCIDKFLDSTTQLIDIETVERFLQKIRTVCDENLEILLLGGEPTILKEEKLIEICNMIHKYNFKAIMSTNGILKQKIVNLIPYFDSIQVTVNSDQEIDFYRNFPDKINIKIAGDGNLNFDKFNHFIEYTKGFSRRSISMYFTPDFQELCTDTEINQLLDTLSWERNGSYEYTFYKDVRIKRCIHGETNIIDEPTVPKLYPNGNYNKTWCNEDMDDYLR